MTKPRVTDHALLRFLERAGGIPVEDIRAHLAESTARAHAAVKAMGGGDYLLCPADTVLLVRDGMLVTAFYERLRGTARKSAHFAMLKDGPRK